MRLSSIKIIAALAVLALAGACNTVTVRTPLSGPDGPEKIRVEVLGEKTIHIQGITGADAPERASLVVLPQRGHAWHRVSKGSDGTVSVKTTDVTVCITPDGLISFHAPDGAPLLEGGRISLKAKEVEGKAGFSVQTVFESPSDEAFFGLGQHQTGEFNRKGTDEELYQYNTKISVPFVLSSRGYGLLFDAYSQSRWGNPEGYVQLGEQLKLYDKDGAEGALTGTYIAKDGKRLVRREDSLFFENEFAIRALPDFPLNGAKVVYEGWIEAPRSGDWRFSQYYAGFQRTLIDGSEVMGRRWRPAWNPNSYKFSVSLQEGVRTPIRVEWEPDGDVSYMGLRVAPLQTPEEQGKLRFSSEFEPSADFYFIAGDSYDEVIHGYRTLTGKAQVLPKWALGFWQSRERYSTQDELVGTLAEFRRRGIPIDNIVQDWQYWEPDQWGSHEFEASRYPDPEKMLDDVHALHGRFMISVWPKFYTNTDNYHELAAAGYAYQNPVRDSVTDWLGYHETFYDAYSKGGREIFWQQMDSKLYSRYGRKIDAWWMDASEPNLRDCLPHEYMKWLLTPTALGPATEYYNAYALVNADAIYNGQRRVDPDKRVFLLTRNGFAGLQRYSTASWSGDIGTSWTDMRMQITAGLGYCMAGLPFWSMDTGGFSVMGKFQKDSGLEEWRELQTRWHQFGAFIPLFRAHGQWPPRELWNIAPEGSPAYESILYYMKLRYRLMPYIYSMAGMVHFDDYTMMRGLPMDFQDDVAAHTVTDQWMFGPALMPCPVCEYGARSREVYLPSGIWYDFYSENKVEAGSGCNVIADAPYERIPLYVRGGSIIPLGPEIQWTDEKPADPLEIVVWPGADASFTLYEDDGLTYGYERGKFSTVTFSWNEASQEFTAGRRNGSWPGMPAQRTFRVRLAGSTDVSELRYDGSAVTILL